ELGDLALDVDGDLLAQVAAGHGGGDVGAVSHVPGEVGRHQVHRVGEVLPRAGHALDLGLTAELPLAAHLPRDAGHLVGEVAQRVGHGVDRVGQCRDLALGLHRDLLAEVAAGHRGGDLGDVADLARQVRRHVVDVVGQVLPRAGHALDLGRAAQDTFGAHLRRASRLLVGERPQLVGHGVDRVVQVHHLALGVDGDLLGQVAAGHRGGDLGDVADLARQVGRLQVDVV